MNEVRRKQYIVCGASYYIDLMALYIDFGCFHRYIRQQRLQFFQKRVHLLGTPANIERWF